MAAPYGASNLVRVATVRNAQGRAASVRIAAGSFAIEHTLSHQTNGPAVKLPAGPPSAFTP